MSVEAVEGDDEGEAAVLEVVDGGEAVGESAGVDEDDGATPAARGPAAPRAGYREVLADRAFLGVLVTVGVSALCDLALTVLLSACVIGARGLPAWQPGTLFAINTVLVVLAQTLVARAVERRRRPLPPPREG
ncbi:hypothetical protein ACQVDT_21840 [Streptomyces sp. RMIT01]